MPAEHARMRRILLRGVVAAVAIVLAARITLEAILFVCPLPDMSRIKDLSPVVLADDGSILKAYLTNDGKWRMRTRVSDVSPLYLAMLLSYEDHRFYSHDGIDFAAVLRAVWSLVRTGHVVSGASTLTMQAVRLLDGQQPGLIGKLRQALLALKLEHSFDKNTILSFYLTLAPFGGNIEGVRAASWRYFGKPPARLSVAQAALLVALPQSPEQRRPDRNRRNSRIARNHVLERALRRGVLTRNAALAAMQQPVVDGRDRFSFIAQHLSDRLHLAHPHQVVIRTLIDYSLQRQLGEIAADFVHAQPDPANIAILVIRKADCAVRAYIGGGDYFDRTRAGMLDLVRAIRSPGSALKPLIYAMAFEDRIVHPATIITDHVVDYNGYRPENFDRSFGGEMTVHDALVRSVNTTAIQLLDKVGPQRFIRRLTAAGIKIKLPHGDAPVGLAVGLGGLGINLENLATLYLGLARGGLVRPLRYLKTSPPGHDLRLTAPDAAWAVINILADSPPTPGRAKLRARDGHRRIAYKTGTSYSYKDAWAVGLDDDDIVAVWVGRPDGVGRLGQTGSSVAVPIMYRVFDKLPVPEHGVAAARPRDSILSRSTNLPPRLRRFPSHVLESNRAHVTPLQIQFPLDGSTIRLNSADGVRDCLSFWASGGRPPLHWYVDGHPVPWQPDPAHVLWAPQGRGELQVTVIDADGFKASSSAWIEQPPKSRSSGKTVAHPPRCSSAPE